MNQVIVHDIEENNMLRNLPELNKFLHLCLYNRKAQCDLKPSSIGIVNQAKNVALKPIFV